MFFGMILIFFRHHISPGGLMVVLAFLLVVSQANMLNPDIAVPTLVKITTILSAITGGGYMVALASYVHEEYGHEQWGYIYGFILSAGCGGLLAYDEGMIYIIQTGFGGKSKAADGMGHFEAYGSWTRFMFLITTSVAGFGLFCAIMGHWFSKEVKRSSEEEDGRKVTETIVF